MGDNVPVDDAAICYGQGNEKEEKDNDAKRSQQP
jgi:hypothetical protein